MANEEHSGRDSPRRGWLRGLLSRRGTSNREPDDGLDHRYARLKEQLREVQQEMHALATDAENAPREVARLHEDIKAAEQEEADANVVARLRTRLDALSKRPSSLRERTETLERRTEDLERESEEVGKLFNERTELYRSASIEGEKLNFEVYKLTATLSAASVVAVSAISVAIGPNPVWAWALYGSYALLLISIVASVLACMNTVLAVVGQTAPGILNVDPRTSLMGRIFAGAAVIGLLGGLMLILNFMVSNVNLATGDPEPEQTVLGTERTFSE